MNTQINITENKTTTLATAGKYCDRDIDINVEVAGEDVATETEAYTEKLLVLETAITELENELDGKINGEDVGDETEVYTDKLATLETAITALETELQGKASGSGNNEDEYCTVSFVFSEDFPTDALCFWLDVYEDGTGSIEIDPISMTIENFITFFSQIITPKNSLFLILYNHTPSIMCSLSSSTEACYEHRSLPISDTVSIKPLQIKGDGQVSIIFY